MSSELAISVRGISKAYRIAKNATSHTTMAEAMLHRLRHPLQRPQFEEFWALRDVDFDIKKGEAVGIIGRNGAGKSTLLKILSRITEPTSGQIDLYGRVGSLLEVGTGFHPELTGRENIFLNGNILGMKRREISSQFDNIVDFAGVDKFLDTPVKRYSSGMYVRLAFAVAAHLNPEILVVDEVLAVGDAEFQKKCLGKMQDVAQSGRTVLFVSHNMAAIQNMCNRAVLLKRGCVEYVGSTEEAIDRYLATGSSASLAENSEVAATRVKWAKPLIKSVRVTDNAGTAQSSFPVGAPIFFEMNIQSHPDVTLTTPVMGIVINDAREVPVTTVNMRMTGNVPQLSPHPTGAIVCEIHKPRLSPGRYSVDFYLGDAFIDHDVIKTGVCFDIEATDFYGSGTPPMGHLGPMLLTPQWDIRLECNDDSSRTIKKHVAV